MKNFTSHIASLLVVGLISFNANAQVKTPMPSPGCEVEQNVGLSKLEVKYSRPGVKGRKIYGDLVPFGKIWRTGANAATTIKVSDNVKIGDNELIAGKYSIFTIPGEKEWTVIFNKNSKAYVSQYKQEEDALRITVKPQAYAEKTESFSIDFANITDNSCDLRFIWENTVVSVPIETPTDAEVMKTIEKTLAGVSSRDYYLSAKYYYQNDKDIKQCLEWINKSVEMDKEKPKFYVVYWQAKILAKSGDRKAAIAAAELSKELSIKAEYESYIKKNDDLINELKK